jgi:hypothetical protein
MLSPDDVRLLEFEESEPGHTGAKEERIRVQLGLTAARYYQRLDHLLTDQDTIARFPQLAGRRLRQRDEADRRRAEISRWRRTA